MTETEKKKKEKKKKRENELERMIFQIIEQSAKKVLNEALDEIFKEWK